MMALVKITKHLLSYNKVFSNTLNTIIPRQIFQFQLNSNSLLSPLNPCKVQRYSGVAKVQIYQGRPRTLDEINVKGKVGKLVAIDTLVQLLNIRRFTAVGLITKTKRLCQVPAVTITENYNLLHEAGIDNNIFLKYPELLAVRNSKDLEQNIEIVKGLVYDFPDVVYLTILDTEILKSIVLKSDFLPRVNLLVLKLETTIDVIIEGLVKRSFLQHISMKRLAEVIDLLKKNNVTGSDIVKDWWVLQYTPKLIQTRIDLTRANNIDPIKTWMVRATNDIFDRYVQRRSDNKLVLGDNTLIEYLSERLQCTNIEATGLMCRHPALQKKSMKKMKEIIDFLYAEGFKPTHICRVPKILLHCLQTTKKRIREMEKQGVPLDSLHMLTKSQKQYMQYYQALVKSNSNKLRDTN